MENREGVKGATLAAEDGKLLLRPPVPGSSVDARPVPSSGLPDDILARVPRRLGILALILGSLVLVEGLVSHAVEYATRDGYPTPENVWDLLGASAIASVSLLMAWVGLRLRLAATTGIRIGIAYLVLIAFLLSFTDHADYFWRGDHRLHGLPAVTALILVFPVVVPLRPLGALVVALLMAGGGPLAMWALVAALGYEPPGAGAQIDAFPLVFAFVAPVLAWIVRQLGLEVKRARRLGAYTLEEKIGGGGMGEVWRASHRFLARPAAVKLISAPAHEAGVGTSLERFEREAQATACLQSPHTVGLYDFGVTEDQRPYYVMELLEGIDLEALVRQFGPQPPERVVAWIGQVCHSLGEAHECGLVHRDVKPANVIVCRYGPDFDFIKVLDFGLVTWGSAIDVAESKLTAEGRLVGTPAYMPPEMATAAEVSPRSDIYAVGCVAYWLLTGKQVFAGGSPIEVILGHVDKAPSPPSEATEQAIPPELDRIVLSCLAKTPDQRPASAGQLARELAACPVASPWTGERARAWWETHLPDLANAPRQQAAQSLRSSPSHGPARA
jgi:serine/threonine-protein kinase